MKKLAWFVAGVGLVAAAVYTVISLSRWEWTRALFFGLIVVVTEVALATALIVTQIRKVGLGSQRRRPHEPDPHVLSRLREHRPGPQRFSWLSPLENRTNVFITMLVGGGVVVSGLAWLLDRLAARTTTEATEVRLAKDLDRISYPRGGLVVDDATALAENIPHCDDPQLRMLLRRAGHGR